MISSKSATVGHTRSQLRPTVYNISIACEAASGHTSLVVYFVLYVRTNVRNTKKLLKKLRKYRG